MGKIVVTGANGFIGTVLCQVLVRNRMETVGIIRSQANVPFEGDCIKWLCKMGGDWDVLNGVPAIDTVIHLAGIASGEDDALLHQVNVSETLELFCKVCQMGVKRFIFLSTVKVHGERSYEPFTEKSPFNPITPYARSKFLAEQRLVEANRSAGVDLVILRPPAVYGPGMKGNLLKIMWLLKQGLPICIPNKTGLRSLIYVDNLVHAILHIITAPFPLQTAFLVSDGHDLDFSELILSLISYMNSQSRIIKCPTWFWQTVGSLPFLGGYIKRATTSLQISPERISQELGWQPVFTVFDALKETSEWFLQKK